MTEPDRVKVTLRLPDGSETIRWVEIHGPEDAARLPEIVEAMQAELDAGPVVTCRGYGALEFDGPRLASGESREFLDLWNVLESRRGKAWMGRRFPVGMAPREILEGLRAATGDGEGVTAR